MLAAALGVVSQVALRGRGGFKEAGLDPLTCLSVHKQETVPHISP